MLQEDYKETREGVPSYLEATTKISDQNSELTLLSSFFLAVEQSEHAALTYPKRHKQYSILHTKK